MTRTSTEMAVCTCGREAELGWTMKLRDCEICGHISCADCRHECADCGTVGCEHCMIKFEASRLQTVWCCDDDHPTCLLGHIDPYGKLRQAFEQQKNMRAAIENIVVTLEALTVTADGKVVESCIKALKLSSQLYLTGSL